MIDEWTEVEKCQNCNRVHPTNPVMDYVMRSEHLGLWKQAAVDPEYAQKKLDSTLKQLAPQKWAKEKYDPRPPRDGDLIRNMSPITIRRWAGEKYKQLIEALERGVDLPGRTQDTGLTFKPGNLWVVAYDDDTPWTPPLAQFSGEGVFVDFGFNI
jgi:hypothetical protein